ncbi:MAG: DUF4332 domain-containing protein [Burkholderiales bacterium]|nr:DUF4332 domain-containing protein [Anaerolineae bacterium]
MRKIFLPVTAFLLGLAIVWYGLRMRDEDETTQDPLTDINGIGPVFEEALNAIGIRSFRQLGRQSPESLAQRLGASVNISADRIRSGQWIEQARARAGA